MADQGHTVYGLSIYLKLEDSLYLTMLYIGASLVAQWERIQLQCRRHGFDPGGGEDPLEQEMGTHSSIPAWRTPWTEKPGRLKSMGSQKSQT